MLFSVDEKRTRNLSHPLNSPLMISPRLSPRMSIVNWPLPKTQRPIPEKPKFNELNFCIFRQKKFLRESLRVAGM